MGKHGMSIQMSTAEQTQKPNVILGDWGKDTARMDFDNTFQQIVEYWGFRAMHWFHQDGFMILKSSERTYVTRIKGKTVCKYSIGNYHLIFNLPVTWEQNMRMMNWVALESGNEGLRKYAMMQAIKRDSTLRMGSKGKKSPPRIVFRYGNQDKQIAVYLDTQRFLLNGIKNNWE